MIRLKNGSRNLKNTSMLRIRPVQIVSVQREKTSGDNRRHVPCEGFCGPYQDTADSRMILQSEGFKTTVEILQIRDIYMSGCGQPRSRWSEYWSREISETSNKTGVSELEGPLRCTSLFTRQSCTFGVEITLRVHFLILKISDSRDIMRFGDRSELKATEA